MDTGFLSAGYNLEDGIWRPKGASAEFGYSDGDEAEERIAAAIRGCDDVSLFSRVLREYQTDWPSRYHLSATRANLLRPLEPLLTGRVLEVGSGCGAISRYLGEIGSNVVALEGSHRRARITASRCRDLPNVRVVNDVLEAFEAESSFDAVTLIGVLEYARVYGTGENPALTWLRKAHRALAPDGVLVIAIENQLGLKYLAGMPEDHVGVPMHGVAEHYGSKTVATYGREELLRMLREAGFDSCEVALPFPDYKFPTSVMMERAYSGEVPQFDAATFASQSASSDPQIPYAPLFPLERAWSVIGKNGLLGDLSNSFLLIARKPAAFTPDKSLPIAHHFATERVPMYCKHVEFRAGDSEICVTRERLLPQQGLEASRPISMRLEAEPYMLGEQHTKRLEQIVTQKGWTIATVANWLNEWIDAACELAGTGRARPASVPGRMLDALPRNLIVPTGIDDAKPVFIDLEWDWHGDIEFRYLVYRSIIGSFTSIVAIARPQDIRHVHLASLLRDLMEACGLPVQDDDVERFVDLDGVVTRLVYGRDSGLSLRWFNDFRLRLLPDVADMSQRWNSLHGEMSAQAVALQEQLDARKREISAKEHEVSAKEHEISELVAQRVDLECALRQYQQASEQLSAVVEGARTTEATLDRELQSIRQALEQHEIALRVASARSELLDQVLASTSWRVTAPLRGGRRLMRPRAMKQALGRAVKRAYDAMPLSRRSKLSLKGAIFTLMPGVFAGTNSFKAWRSQKVAGLVSSDARLEAPPQLPEDAGNPVFRRYVETVMALPSGSGADYVAIAESAPSADSLAARAIAFYLPQFHPIPENDAWWGRGFTEWTNVSKAVPQFIGHYQPHLPGELGFYDLRLVDVMRRQAELAKLYGIEGFCFHYYWFGGRRLLERPLQQLVDSDIDLPFCICWANENWTRRWDGLDSEVLMAQDYGPKDDLAFIKALEPLLRDKRYIRVDGRPLIILYRPSLLPDPAATLERWRAYCREAGIGELYLAMVQFDKFDPREYGFDSAIEFPPHKIAAGLRPINEQLEIINENYLGSVVDYADVVDNALSIPVPEYDMIRGVFPAWDNEARKPGRGYTVAKSTPGRYRAWLRAAIDYANTHPVRGEKLVFINAWNEWAEGAHLEPDRRYGYAYLDATRQALSRPICAEKSLAPKGIAVIIHAFYPELLGEMLAMLKQWTLPCRLLITTVSEQEEGVRQALQEAGLEGEVLVHENRGRDILPFLRAMKLVREGELVLKLHTKRSLHRVDGEEWRKDLLHKLLAPAGAERIFAAFSNSPDLGLVAPDGHILPMSTYWGANADTVHALSKRMYSAPVDPATAMFAAGSMFYVRPDAIQALLDLNLQAEDFEPEAGQVDGTLAHAIERCFSVATCSSGHYLASSEHPTIEVYRTVECYSYAQRSH
jgi:lipopolysaccharide biosynthesis protein/SAM-dependent methyltransferase